MKKTLVILLLCAMLLSFASCAKAPKTEEIYDRAVYLIENAYALNEVFAGAGLPVRDRTHPAYASLYADYQLIQYTRDYDIVSEKAKFGSAAEIREAAEKIFSPELLEKILYVNAFEGQVLTDAPGGSLTVNPRYIEDGTYLYQSVNDTAQAEKTRPAPLIFDYATMKAVKPSNKTTVRLTLDAWEADSPDAVFSYRVTLVRGAGGEWLLDKLTV